MRSLAVVLLAGGLALPASASTPEPQGAELEYRVYVGGIGAARYAVRYTATEGRTAIALTGQTEGMTDWFAGWRATQFAEAEFDPRAPHIPPRIDYRSASIFRSEPRDVRLSLFPDRPADWWASPEKDDEPRTPIDAGQTQGVLDPLTASFLSLSRIGDSQTCPDQLSVFDGRRRFDAVFRPAQSEVLKASSYNMFAGPTLVCRFVIKRLGGYVIRETDWNRPEDRERPITVHLASVLPGHPRIPVRIESELSMGSIVVHLVAARPATGATRMAALPPN